ncbi:hypothetical protein V7S43_004236 [Phytophthora oleae]|uniref:Uncharacterized protein n=1 Tax=Phytophthora oleae TaxID=2107226 RepID=A0ABD3FWC1_9STRA
MLSSSFRKSPYVLVDYYSDNDCNVLSQTFAFLADGKCHEFYDVSRVTSQRTTVYANGRVTIEGPSSHGSGNEPCSSAYEVQVDQPAANINTGTCIQTTGQMSKKYYSVGTSPPTDTAAASSSTDTTNSVTNATTTASSAEATSILSSATLLIGAVVSTMVMVF